MTDNKKIGFGKWVGGILAAVVAAGAGTFITWLLPGGWGTIFSWLGAFFGWFANTATVPYWLLGLLGLGSLLLVLLVVIEVVSWIRGSKGVAEERKIDGILWRWISLKSGHIRMLVSYCPKCDLQIYGQDASVLDSAPRVVYFCENCKNRPQPLDFRRVDAVEDFVRRKIQQERRTGEK